MIFDAADFVTRDCVAPGEAWGADLLIFAAYIWIPITLGVALRTWKYSPERWAMVPLWAIRAQTWIYGAFIVFCGLGHLCEFLAWYWPAYRLFTLIDVATAAVSIAVATTQPFMAFALRRRHHAS